ncbi:division/cell wall cluster transcriptional repressor MraZ [Williamsia sp. Leaf354]|jgi:MraZ protein|uniref:Transcriptional regulator MraZ n=1 Tax=Williamsia herbipolensis TaxID=1603258 RepID=A0AAU4K516_9NOCA|nr:MULTISPECIES: division/cell wall cluster transcriptional repressor MraZ [Williamsia]KQR97831.1 division/cell wall cluster transcriptional repressor MraZ [Williamsia sp. Leaf354]MCX6470665.1 division/cell wall cluster transcriptional repressor MraZ [Mycobacteriales bacterium]
MFLGTHLHKLDDKGRLTLPAKFREQLAGGMMVTRGQDHSLAIYLPEDFVERAKRAAAASKVDEKARMYQRHLNSSTEEMVPDAQGRITLSSKHRTYAGLTKECAVIGNYDYVEIWDAQAWEQYESQHEESFSRADNPSLENIL